MRRLSLRTQITLSTTLLVLIVVALAGLVIALRIEHQDSAQVDAQLRARAAKVQVDAAKPDSRDSIQADDGKAPNSAADSTLLAGTDAITRILANGKIVEQRGAGIPVSQIVPAAAGLSTIHAAGQNWRSFVASITTAPNRQLQLLQSLAPVEQRLRQTRKLIAMIALLSALTSAIAAWTVAGLVLRPLRRLRHGALTIRASADTNDRLPDVTGPLEISELSATLNRMLERLQTSMKATRRFTADAGHEIRTPLSSLGMDIETLRRNPDLPATRQTEMLDAMAHEHARVVALLDGLQQLARGDAHALPESTTFDIAEIVKEAVETLRQRYPAVTFRLNAEAQPVVDGWPDGIRLALTNLLDNAAQHGRPDGDVDVLLTTNGTVIQVRVDDDGQGIPAEERKHVLERFARGAAARGPGSGLGLALVKQQAELHQGQLMLAEAPTGGLRAVFSMPTRRG